MTRRRARWTSLSVESTRGTDGTLRLLTAPLCFNQQDDMFGFVWLFVCFWAGVYLMVQLRDQQHVTYHETLWRKLQIQNVKNYRWAWVVKGRVHPKLWFSSPSHWWKVVRSFVFCKIFLELYSRTSSSGENAGCSILFITSALNLSHIIKTI